MVQSGWLVCVSLACVFISWNTFKVYILKLQPSSSVPVIHARLVSSAPLVVSDFTATWIILGLSAWIP